MTHFQGWGFGSEGRAVACFVVTNDRSCVIKLLTDFQEWGPVRARRTVQWFHRYRDACRSAGAVRSAGSPRSQLQSDRRFRDIDPCSLVAGVLVQCSTLTHLNLNNNEMGSGGAERLSEVLAQCTAMAHLDLSSNRIRAAGAESLEGVLTQCAALAHLDLHGNRFSLSSHRHSYLRLLFSSRFICS